jgi:hypothetical protein
MALAVGLRTTELGRGGVAYALLGALAAIAACGGETVPDVAPMPMPMPSADAAVKLDAEPAADDAITSDAAEPADGEVPPDDDAATSDAASRGDVAADLAVDLRSDVRPDRGPLTQEERYREFLEDATSAISSRGVECFHSPPIDPSLPAPDSGLWVSLRNGFTTVDDAAAAACIAAITEASCADLAADNLGGACAAVLAGHVANGKYCRIDDDCTDATQNFCKFDFGMACGSRCAPRAKLGEKCADVCTTDTFCTMAADGNRCAGLVSEGQSCAGGECASGLFCQHTGDPMGKCRRIAAGIACAGTWQCPGSLACVVPEGAGAGVCGPGHAVGAACHVLESGGVIDSDCAPGLRCLPGAGGKLSCSLGHELGESCAIPDGVTVAGEPCRVGICKDGSQGPICTALRQLGQSCNDDNLCDAGLACRGVTCAPDQIPSGDPCGASDERKCAPGTFCRIDASATAGVCAPLRGEGEACQLEECAPPADCQNNVCTRCL